MPALGGPPRGPSQSPDHQRRGEASKHRRDREGDQRPEDPNPVQSVHPAPIDRVDPPFDDSGPDEAAHQGMT